MVLFATILIASLILFFIGYNLLATRFKLQQRSVIEEYQKLVDQASRLESERRELGKELASLEKKLNFLKHEISPKATLAKGILLPEDEEITPDMRMGDYMLTQGMISMEQHLKAMKMLDQLNMDFAAVCQTLGFIDAAQAKAIKKQIK